jgi:hypothetical protein
MVRNSYDRPVPGNPREVLVQIRDLNAEIRRESAELCYFLRSAQIDQQHLVGFREEILKFNARELFRLR